jgi:putative phosphoribosyl transferase
MSTVFDDRAEAGKALAKVLKSMKIDGRIVVLALPRGGVPVAAEISTALGAELDLVLVRKIGAPFQPELAVAAIVDGVPPDIVVDEETSRLTGVDRGYIEAKARRELSEIERRRCIYLAGRQPVQISGATAIVVDDGIATGTTMRAALKALRRRQPNRLVLAVPVAPSDSLAMLRAEVDDIVCLSQPSPFHAIGPHYRDFHQVSDEEVLAALDRGTVKVAVPQTAKGSQTQPS